MKHVLMALGSYDYSAHKGIARYAGAHAWHLNTSVLKSFQMPHNWRGDGIITSLNNSSRLVDFVRQSRVPCVDISSWREDIPMPRVTVDNAKIGEVAANHFIEMGHSHCAWYALSGNPVGKARFEGFRQRLATRGIEPIRLDGGRAQDGAVVLDRLVSLPKPCAIFCKSDYDAAWLSDLCLSANIQIPEELAILGVDNNELICANQLAPLSSVNHDLERIGYEGAALLDRLMNGESNFNATTLVQPDGLTIRKSTDALATSDPVLKSALQYLEANYHRPLSTSNLAEQLGVSRRTLENRFREILNTTVRERLIQIRIENSMQMLKQTSYPIEDVAVSNGFCHAPHFSNTFRKRIGKSPTAYRSD